MADISADALKKEVKAILQGADLSKVTSKVVRQQVEEKLGVDLSHRRKEIDALIMADVEDQVSSEEVSEEEAPRARAKPAKSDSDAEDNDDDYTPSGGAAKKVRGKPKPKKRKAGSDEDSDEDWGKRKKVEQAAAKKAAGGPKKQSAFTKSFRLSPELADVVGAEVMPRHEVVKKLWAVIKERNLQDPKQKQFAICDDQLLKVFGIKRFRTFGMMKYLKDHFVEAV